LSVWFGSTPLSYLNPRCADGFLPTIGMPGPLVVTPWSIDGTRDVMEVSKIYHIYDHHIYAPSLGVIRCPVRAPPTLPNSVAQPFTSSRSALLTYPRSPAPRVRQNRSCAICRARYTPE